MTKFALAVFVTIFAVAQGYPNPQLQDNDIGVAAAKGDWDLVHKLIQQHFDAQKSLWGPIETAGNVRSLTPPPGGHVYGEAEYTFKASQNNNGQKTENKGGHRIVNQDGVVTEFDIEPKY